MSSEKAVEERRFLNVDDVVAIMCVSESMAYKIIRDLNSELKKEGYITVAGKISRRYFESKVMI